MAMQTFDDDFESIPTTQQVAPAQKAQTAAAPATRAAAPPVQPPKPPVTAASSNEDDEDEVAAVEDNENLDTDFNDEKVYLRPGQLNQCRPDKGKASRFALIPKEWIAPQTAKRHFEEVPGKDGKPYKQGLRCLTPMTAEAAPAYCCKTFGKDGEVNVIALVVHYTNADPVSGKYEKDANGVRPPVKFEIQFVRLSQFNMKQIKKLPDEDKTPFDIDIVMTHADRAFGYEFNRVSNSPRWKSDPAVVEAVKQACQRFLDGKVLRAKLGRKLNEIEYKALLSGRKVGGDAKLDNVEEL
jgi:hypothetical protein